MSFQIKTEKQIIEFLNTIIDNQRYYENKLSEPERKKNGVFLTNSLCTIEKVLGVIDLGVNIFSKNVLEPACGQGIFILKLLADIYINYCDKALITSFISEHIYFVDIQKELVEITQNNIRKLYHFLFDDDYPGELNGIIADFTDKPSFIERGLFDNCQINKLLNLYDFFDYVIGNPPYISLYGRRDKKESEKQRIKYLHNYRQFPKNVKNGKLNYVMLFFEHSLEFLKTNGKLSFIVDVAFFETAYKYTRKYLLENTQINELQLNISDFDVTSGQIIITLTKNKSVDNNVKIIDNQKQCTYFVSQKKWYNKDDEYKFRYNECSIFKQITDKVKQKNDKTILQLFPFKNLRTCTMLLDMEDKFTSSPPQKKINCPIYPYYQGSKSLSEKFGKLTFTKYFYYDKLLQDKINDELKIKLERQGIKNKKRIGLGEKIIYDNPKLFIRQSSKEIIATIDFEKSAANNSLYVFSLRNDSPGTINFMYFLCGFLNSDFITYYAQQMNIIRFSKGKQPQIKISDLSTIHIPQNIDVQNKISSLCKKIYIDKSHKEIYMSKINDIVYAYYDLNEMQKNKIQENIKCF